MEPRLQTRIQRYGWDAAAGHYDTGWEAQLRPAHDRLLEMAMIDTGERVIETACGSGLVTLRRAGVVGPERHVLATDLSKGMIDEVRSRRDAAQLSTIETARMAAEQLDVADRSFDASVCALGLMYTPDRAAAVAEMARVVVLAGIVAATVWGECRRSARCFLEQVLPAR